MFGNATEFEFDYNGDTALIVGYVNAHPRHPDAGTAVTPFAGVNVDPDDAPALFALVSVDWATPLETIDLATGAVVETGKNVNIFGLPQGLTWNVSPVSRHEGGYVLSQGWYAAGHHTATIPAAVRAQVTGAPATVKIHDFPVR